MKIGVIVKILIALTLLLFAFSLWQRSPDIDDAWIGEHAYWMAKIGHVKSELMHGITNQENRHIVHHKLFTLNGALFISIFGFSLMTIKSVSLLWLGIFLLIFIRYVKKELGSDSAWFAFLLITINALVFQYSFVFRPEIMVMTLGFVSYLFIEKSFKQSNNTKLLIFSGLFAGLAAATHLNGLIFMAAGFLLLLWHKRYKATIIFAASTLPAFAIYFYDFTQEFNFNYWIYQINDSPALYKSSILPSSFKFLAKLLNEHLRFFHSPKEISLSLLFLFTLIVNFRKLKSDKNLLKYLLLLILLLSLIAMHTTSKYILLYLPFISLIIIRSFHDFYTNRESKEILKWKFTNRTAYRWSLALLGLFVAVHFSWNVNTASEKFNPVKNREFAEKHFGKQTDNLNILAPMTFIFNEIDNFNRIQSDLGITELHKAGLPVYGVGLLNLADSLNIDYLVVTDEYRDRFLIDSLKPIDFATYGYAISDKEQGFIIIKKQGEHND